MNPQDEQKTVIYTAYDQDGNFDWPPRERVFTREQLARRAEERNRGLQHAGRLGLFWFLRHLP